MGGTFITRQKALVDFKFPKLKNMVTWICHVYATTDPNKAMYDLIIGMDLMTELGIVVNTAKREVQWENHTTPD